MFEWITSQPLRLELYGFAQICEPVSSVPVPAYSTLAPSMLDFTLEASFVNGLGEIHLA